MKGKSSLTVVMIPRTRKEAPITFPNFSSEDRLANRAAIQAPIPSTVPDRALDTENGP